MRKPLLSIGLSQFGLSILQSLFMFYYVKVYIDKFHVSEKWFTIAQALFMVWNTINDPIFGYLQEIRGSWLNNRLLVIKTLSPFLVGSFIFTWIPWNTGGSYLEGVHLIISLFLYDAFFSAIGVAWGALFADTTQNQPLLRVKALKYSQIAIMLSACSIPAIDLLSKSVENLFLFQTFCVGAALLSIICLWFGSQLGENTPFSKKEDEEIGLQQALIQDENEENQLTFRENIDNSINLTKQILSQKQFLAIVLTNFFQTLRSAAHMNFAGIIVQILIPDILPSGSVKKAAFLLILILAPQILLILNESLIARVGAVNVISVSYIVSFVSGFMIIMAQDPYLIMVFMFVDCLTVHTIAPLFNIIISDFVDDDARKNKRQAGIPSIIFSLNALVTKPAQSVAPVIIVFLLSQSGYQNFLTSKTSTEELKQTTLWVLFMTPVLIGAIQYVIMKTLFNFRRPLIRNTHVI